jgi:AcrR family transcriptional regulator
MDLREKKTIRSIENAFLQLRAKKPLERITVKELVELAEVSKSTFYAHYQDVYDLSDKMQKDVIKEIYDSIQSAELFFSNPIQFAHESFRAFLSHREELKMAIQFPIISEIANRTWCINEFSLDAWTH